MKYTLVIFCLAVFSFERISGDFNYVDKEIDYLKNYVENEVNNLIKPVYIEFQQITNRFKLIQAQSAGINTAQCQELQGTLKNAALLLEKIPVTLFQNVLKIKQDLQNIEHECVNGTVPEITNCVKQHFIQVVNEVVELRSMIVNDIQEVKSTALAVENQFVQCMKSQVVTSNPAL